MREGHARGNSGHVDLRLKEPRNATAGWPCDLVQRRGYGCKGPVKFLLAIDLGVEFGQMLGNVLFTAVKARDQKEPFASLLSLCRRALIWAMQIKTLRTW